MQRLYLQIQDLRGRGISSLIVSTHRRAGSGGSLLLAAPEYSDITESWFSAEFWGSRARPVSTGGRGGAWFIETGAAELVLRHYRRGGMVARLVEKAYFFTGFDSTRSLAEFRLLQQLQALGLPVPEPVAAIAWKKKLLWYHAAILVKRIPGAVTLPESHRLQDPLLWQKLGGIIRRFHDIGLNHVDLNCDNILVAGGSIFLIDFDRCQLVADKDNDPDAVWKQGNLERLHRSVEKRCTFSSAHEQKAFWELLLRAYQSSSGSDDLSDEAASTHAKN